METCTGERFVVQGKAVWTVRCNSGSQQQLSIQCPQQQPAMEEQLGCTGEMARLQVHSTASFVTSFYGEFHAEPTLPTRDKA